MEPTPAPPATRLTIAEAATELLQVLSPAQLAELRETDSPFILHFTYGLFIRNHFQLWSKTPRVEPGKSFGEPDDLSAEILTALRELLATMPTLARH